MRDIEFQLFCALENDIKIRLTTQLHKKLQFQGLIYRSLFFW